jgi:hypothetical protein
MMVGGCLCGGVRYEYRGEIAELSLCHCSQCRKAQGSAYVAVCPIETKDFVLLTGRELLKEYRATPNKARVFCSNCGSPLYSKRDDLPNALRLRVGTIETPFECKSTYHIHVASKAAWEHISDSYRHFDGPKI